MSRKESDLKAIERNASAVKQGLLKQGLVRLLRFVSGLVFQIVVAIIFALAFVIGILIHLPIPPSKRLATRLVAKQVSAAIQGSVTVEKISRLHWGGMEALGVTIRDPRGEEVLSLPKLHARANLLQIGMSALPWSDRFDIPVTWVGVEHVDVVLRQDQDGVPTLSTTFLEPTKKRKPKPTTPSKPSRLVLDFETIEVGSVAIKGKLGGLSPIDWRAKSLRGSVHVDSDDVRIDISAFPLTFHRVLKEPIQTTVDYHFRSPSLMWTVVLARYEELALSGRVQFNDNNLRVDFDLPKTEGTAFAAYLPESVVLADPLEGKIEAHGPLSVLDTHVRLQSARTLVDAKGEIRLTPDFRTSLDVDVRSLDLQRIMVDAPKTDLNADVRAALDLAPSGLPRTRVIGSVDPTVLFDVPLPGMDVDALVDAKGVSGLAHIHEQGMPMRADFTVSPDGKVKVSAVANIPSLSAAPRLSGVAQGYAVAKVDGTYETGELDAKLSVTAGNLARDEVRIESANLALHAWGPLDALHMSSTLRGAGLHLAGAKWNSFDSSLRGPILSPRLRLNLQGGSLPSVRLKTHLDVRDQFVAKEVEVELEHGRELATMKTDRVEVRDGVVDLGAMAIDGVGEPIDVIARVGASGFDLRLVSDGVDLDRLSHMLALPGPRVQGTAAVDIDLRNIDDQTHGCVWIDVRDGKVHSAAPLPQLDASLSATFAGRHIDVDTSVSMGGRREGKEPRNRRDGMCLPVRAVREDGLAELHTSGTLVLAGSPMDPEAWQGITGTARVIRALVNLDRVEQTVAPWMALGMVPKDVPQVGGTIQLSGEIVRDRADAPPAWTLSATTKALRVDLGGSDDARRIAGADIFAAVSMRQSGLFQSSLCVRDDMGAYDSEPCDPTEENVLVSVGLLAELDYQRLYEQPAAWKEILLATQMDGRVVIHDRPAQAILRPLPLKQKLPVEANRVGASVGIRGTVLAPHFDYRVQLGKLGPQNSQWRAPTTVCAQGQYDGQRAWLHTTLQREKGGHLSLEQVCSASSESIGSIGYVDADMKVAWKDILAWSSLPRLPWEANITAVIDNFELADVPILSDNGISGLARVAGKVKGLGTKPEFDVQLGLESIRTGPTVDYDQGNVHIRTDASGFSGSLALIDVDEDGKLTSSCSVVVNTEQVKWQDGLVPTRDGSKPVDIEVTAKKFKMAMLTPLVQPILSYVDGNLTGTARATWSPEEGDSKIHQLFFLLDEGAFQVPLIGQEFLSATGMVQAAGSDRIFLERFRAQSLTGAIEGRATLDLAGLKIEHVDASLRAREQEKMRLTFEGMPIGEFYGDIHAKIDLNKEKNNAQIVFDHVHIDLPTTDLRSVQSLEDNPDIQIVPSRDAIGVRKPEASDSDPATPWVVTLETRGPALLERSDINVSIITPKAERDRPVLVFPDPKTGETSLKGYLILYDGRVDVVGNFFELEENNARIVFSGDPGNPTLNITARWDAPDGTRVFVDVTGSLRKPRIQFRSEPAMQQAEIIALVLFGAQSGSGTTTTGSQDDEGGSTDAGGGIAASAGINMLLRDLSPVNISTRIDTSSGQSASPTVIVQVSRDISAEATYVPEEQNLENTDRYLLTFDWRFLRQWSLRITRGNAGTSILDLLWQHRY